MKLRLLSLSIGLLFVISCEGPQKDTQMADMIIYNGPIYTMDENQPTAEAVASRDGEIIYVGDMKGAEELKAPSTEMMDLDGNTMLPGLIESHAHMMGIGYGKLSLDLTQVANYDELVAKVAEAVKNTPKGEWILGRGWHQSKWTPAPATMVKGYQSHEALSAVSPDHPVFLTHASGHASFANAKAMEIAGIKNAQKYDGEDGEIILHPDGKPTGVFSERAGGLIQKHIPETTPERARQALELAIEECLANGITSFHDAGAGQATIDLYNSFKEEGKMDVRIWVMLSGGNADLLEDWYKKGPVKDDYVSVGGIKLYSDGALGSRGAWLLEEYSDRKGHVGNPIMPLEQMHGIAVKGLEHDFQVCVHAIGDKANQEVLNQFEKAIKAHSDPNKEHRFRIEHAQHLDLEDIPRFAELGVIASMQGIHMSSDRPWAIDRLGEKRIIDGAYVWQKLLQSGAVVINGTDSPVEPVSPIASFYASVTRRTLAGTPEEGYEANQKMSREQALRSYTLDAAYGAFQENQKGSIEKGKFADFTILSQDLMKVADDKILETKIMGTIVGGKLKYKP
ncbi:MAG: amidohydrolase [Bacteroidia bacterium]|nr:amidohydrolase [Bacteroidia bacterium]